MSKDLAQRSTVAVICTCWSRVAAALPALYSWKKLSRALPSTITPMMSASIQSPSSAETAVAKIRIRTTGLSN